MVVVKRALLSCYDKTGLDAFAKTLASLGVELVASGGTAECLRKQGLRITTVEEFTGVAEQLDGRVKTLHPKIHAGILARRDDPTHVQAVGERNLIDLVVVNLYPFEQTVQRPGISLDEAVEQIDIGGVALLRAAAKNFAHVAVVSQPSQYGQVAQALRQGTHHVPDAMARQLAVSAFHLTSAYDTWISRYLEANDGPRRAETASVSVRKHQELRYGENPHQQGAWYVPAEGQAWGFGTLSQLQGKALSYNNLLDLDAALRCLVEFEDPTCAIVKHHMPCGVAGAATLQQAYERALACDAESAFGGVVGFNRPIGADVARQLTATFLEVIMAPSVEPQALTFFQKKPNLRVVTLAWPSSVPVEPQWRQLSGAWLLQEPDRVNLDERTLQVATTRAPTEAERKDLRLAWTVAKHVRSNAIVLASNGATVGIGQGQPSRVGSVRLAIEKAGDRSRESIAASDGFFPFPDSIELLAKAGVRAVIQPGGSIRDADVIAAANHAKMAMLVTGIRHFKH